MLNFKVFNFYVDGSGVQYIANGGNNRIRNVDQSGTITTIAGNSTRGFSGDGGPATEASQNWPLGIEFDRDGNLYITDLYNHRIRKVDTSGIITTVAGGYWGKDGGPAVKAFLWEPISVWGDIEGNLFIADCLNHRIRKVDSAGIITTIAGTGKPGYSGYGGPAIEAMLAWPKGIRVAPDGSLFIVVNNAIRKLYRP